MIRFKRTATTIGVQGIGMTPFLGRAGVNLAAKE